MTAGPPPDRQDRPPVPAPYAPPSGTGGAAHAELPDSVKMVAGIAILISLLAVTTQLVSALLGIFIPTPLLILSHPAWQGVSILLVPILVIYRVFRRKQRTWKIDVRSSGWANFFLWWGVLYYVLLGAQLILQASL